MVEFYLVIQVFETRKIRFAEFDLQARTKTTKFLFLNILSTHFSQL